ncbi:MAG: ferritin-like domain-containing protein [Labilithrix sp.]|nr:ferritin-like domain-containing protein [Labilithrix sp.]MCW5834540.1 ferritin-like domain-containing protein [Labilithrix sp.]
MRGRLEGWLEALDILLEVRDPRVLRSLGPSGVKGLILRRAKQGVPTKTRARHEAHFDWTYPADNPEMRKLYERAKKGQWNSDSTLAWSTSVDPYDPARPLLPDGFLDFDALEARGPKLDARERARLVHSVASWMLSQFLHGEQGALFAAAQVTEAVQFYDGKLYGATQVMDEGRHVEVFHRYLDEKLCKLYQLNDNLFVIIDALMTDSRWDMKFLGMQIMVEGLALGAFGTLYRQTGEPLLKELLKYVIRDEARHVHYGVLALRQHFRELSDSERREREDWAFEVALLMRDRFLAVEVYEEWFEGVMSRGQWKSFVTETPGMVQFRQTMFSRLVPNLREIGLVSPRIVPRYRKVGLAQYMNGLAADRIDGAGMIADLDRAA